MKEIVAFVWLIWVLAAVIELTEGVCLVQPDADGHVQLDSSYVSVPVDAFQGCTELVSIGFPS